MRNQNKRAMELISKKSNRKLGIKQCLQKVPQSRPRVKVKVTCLNITFVKVKVTHVNNTGGNALILNVFMYQKSFLTMTFT